MEQGQTWACREQGWGSGWSVWAERSPRLREGNTHKKKKPAVLFELTANTSLSGTGSCTLTRQVLFYLPLRGGIQSKHVEDTDVELWNCARQSENKLTDLSACDVLLPLKTRRVWRKKRQLYLPRLQKVEETHRAASLRPAKKEREQTWVRERATNQSNGHNRGR